MLAKHLSPIFIIALCTLVARSQQQAPNLTIIPAPAEISVQPGRFVINASTTIGYDSESDKKVAEFFGDYVREALQITLPVKREAVGESVIYFSSKGTEGLPNDEAYTLVVAPDRVHLQGKNAGLFYAMQTLTQLLPKEDDAQPAIPAVTIRDEPRYRYRGMHLDVCRHLFPIEFIKKYIDFIAAYKLNNFHWHLTEDQGWRIEIKKYPKLTEVGAYRAQTLIGNNKQQGDYDATPYGGFYTQDEIREVVAYAAERYVNVVPEIEMPGHALAALASYPYLGCGDNPGPYKTAETWGVFDDVFCAGKEETFAFLEAVIDEVIELFPSEYIHIGGDECPKTRWQACPYCQKRMKNEGLKDEHELQSYFVQRMEKYINAKGRRIIGWDEILEGGLAPNATVMSWRGDEGARAAAKQGHDVIMTAHTYGLYFDNKQGPDTHREPLNIGGYAPLEKVYAADPTPKALSEAERKHILGVQANMWTEYMETDRKVEFMLLPRLYALSEIAWTTPDRKNWKDFSEVRVPAHLAKIDQTETVYRVPEVIGLKDTVIYASEYVFKGLQPSVLGGKIYYTINNFNPTDTDLEYRDGVTVVVPKGKERVFKAIVVAPSGRHSNYVRAVIINSKSPETTAK
ncbi:hexosaminidase [Parapedobacter luteus]|uniref:beta-N-acetylhexosaminidase n=1 Tax=Parapedobacter luteus TaxID=623280 RepID=A0A1T5DQ43_9SPHI|nr:family 20 glycosylhydrolase [Parapedobacter luteus]SKB73751.1 hexosaminidase [Parapedobacter luteus]